MAIRRRNEFMKTKELDIAMVLTMRHESEDGKEAMNAIERSHPEPCNAHS